MDRLSLNTVRQQASLVMGSLAHPRLGLVSSYDPATFTAKVRLMPEDIETGWLPIQGAGVGRGFGIYAAPALGDQVVVLFQEASPECGIIIGGLPSDEDVPPNVPEGQAVLTFNGATVLAFNADGSVTLAAPGGLKVTGDITATGEVTSRINETPAALGKVRDAYVAHKHVETGSITQLSDHVTGV